MLAFTLDISAATISAAIGGVVFIGGIAGVLYYAARKRLGLERAAAATAETVRLEAQLKISEKAAQTWESLYRAEQEGRERVERQVQEMQGRIDAVEAQLREVKDLNLAHQKLIQQQGETIDKLRERLASHNIAHEDIG